MKVPSLKKISVYHALKLTSSENQLAGVANGSKDCLGLMLRLQNDEQEEKGEIIGFNQFDMDLIVAIRYRMQKIHRWKLIRSAKTASQLG